MRAIFEGGMRPRFSIQAMIRGDGASLSDTCNRWVRRYSKSHACIRTNIVKHVKLNLSIISLSHPALRRGDLKEANGQLELPLIRHITG